MHRQREVLRSNKNHGVLVNGGVGACKDRHIIRRHLHGLAAFDSLLFDENIEGSVHPLRTKDVAGAIFNIFRKHMKQQDCNTCEAAALSECVLRGHWYFWGKLSHLTSSSVDPCTCMVERRELLCWLQAIGQSFLVFCSTPVLVHFGVPGCTMGCTTSPWDSHGTITAHGEITSTQLHYSSTNVQQPRTKTITQDQRFMESPDMEGTLKFYCVQLVDLH